MNLKNLNLLQTAPKASKKALFIAIMIIVINECCGSFILVSYTATIFATSGSVLSPNLSAIIVGFIQFIGTYISTIYIDRAGRKVILQCCVMCNSTSINFLRFSFCLSYRRLAPVLVTCVLVKFSIKTAIYFLLNICRYRKLHVCQFCLGIRLDIVFLDPNCQFFNDCTFGVNRSYSSLIYLRR